MADSNKVKERYYNAMNELFPKLKTLPSVRQLVRLAGGSNSTAEKYIHAWCLENNVAPPSKEKKKLNATVEEAIEVEIEQRTLDACISYSEEVSRLENSNHELQEEVEALRNLRSQLELQLKGRDSQNAQLLGQIHQLEREVEAARAETLTERQGAENYRETADCAIESFRQKALEADELRKKAEWELAALPENNKRAETDLLIAQVLSRALEREAWLESQQGMQVESVSSTKRSKAAGRTSQPRSNQ